MSDDNPSAFPQADRFSPQGEPGMSLRDWFAGQALAGWMSDPNASIAEPELRERLAAGCYEMADAMLAERRRKA